MVTTTSGSGTSGSGTARTFGKSLRSEVPRSSHGAWSAPADRPDPVEIITAQNASRLQWLVPIRHWRMSQSPFAFYRGAAKIMAQDLSGTPSTGIIVQICGDSHLSNFGVYGSPERDLVFDVNDFDETLPGPWEWDLKRLAASFAIAARHNRFEPSAEKDLARTAAATYRDAMNRFASDRFLDAWYAHLDVEDIYEDFEDQLTKKDVKSSKKFVRKARKKDSLFSLKKLAEEVHGSYRIAADPPLIVPLRDFPRLGEPVATKRLLKEAYEGYLDSVPDDVGLLLRRFRYSDFAIKVVGVGSVGTRAFIVLLEGRNADDPFFLQVKEAGRSVLENYLPASAYTNHGQRVVEGQRLMQATSDTFLGWNTGTVDGRDFYWRQLKDMKASVDVDDVNLRRLSRYAQLCGWTLARAHARSGKAAEISGYLGSGHVFAEALGEFATAYAGQNAGDYAAFTAAISDGIIEAHQ